MRRRCNLEMKFTKAAHPFVAQAVPAMVKVADLRVTVTVRHIKR